MALVEEVVEEYRNSLGDLHFNSKPLISMLTMLADDHEQHAPEIVKVIEAHINKCKPERKLPVLYLMDSIMKNLGKSSYGSLFARNIVQTFTSVFEQVDEKTRASMFKLRQTWTEVLPNLVLYRIDVRIKNFLDPAWPITAKEPEKAIHVNPKFLQGNSEGERSSPEAFEDSPQEMDDEEGADEESIIRQKLIAKNKELLQLKEARLKLELAEAEEKLKQQKKQGTKTHSKSSSVSSTIGVPYSSADTVKSVLDIKPSEDPRPRPTDPRLRDPRLKNKVAASSGHGSVTTSASAKSSMSSKPTFQPLNPSTAYSASQTTVVDPRRMMASYNVGQQQVPAGKLYGHPAGMSPSGIQAGQVFTGEVFTPEGARFSDDNDSDSSRSSTLDSYPGRVPPNVRDPRHIMEQNRNESNIKHKHGGNGGDKFGNKQSTSKHLSSEPKDPRRHAATGRGRNSKDGDVHSGSPRKSSSSSSSKHRSRSRERDSKFENKQKELLEAEQKRKEEIERKQLEENERKQKEEERKREEIEQKKKEEAERKRKEENKRKEEMERKKREEIERKRKEEMERKQLIAKKLEEERRLRSLEAESKFQKSPKLNSNKNREGKDKKVNEKFMKKKRTTKGKFSKDTQNEGNSQSLVKEDVDPDKRPKFRRETEKRSSGDKADLDRATKKQKLDNESSVGGSIEENPNVVDKDCHEEDMDLESESDTNDVPNKIEDDISDLFGGEDEDYRPVVQKSQLPLKSPSNKGWDRFKATHSDQYAYDIELKKQRQDSVVEQKPARMDENDEPQDEDLRVLRPEYQRQISSAEQIQLPKHLSNMDQHAEILITANKQLTNGKLTHDQYQELVKQLSKLVEIQKLQEQNRCLSEELHQPMPGTSESDLVNRISPRESVREVRSPDKPLDPFTIPKKRVQVKEEDDRVKSELSQLYPESPVDKYGPNVELFNDQDEIKIERQNYGNQPWPEGRDDRRPLVDEFDRRGLPGRRPDVFPGAGERFERAPDGPGVFPTDSRGFHGEGDVEKLPSERRCLLKSPPKEFDAPPEVRSPKGPYRDGRAWRNGNWDEDKNRSGRGRGGYRGRGRGSGRPGRDFDRREDEREFFDGPPDRDGFRDDRLQIERDWRDTRRTDDRNEHGNFPRDFDSRGPRDRFSDNRGAPERFRDDRMNPRDRPEEFLPDSRPGRGMGRHGPRDAPHWIEHDRDIKKEPGTWGESPPSWEEEHPDDKRGPGSRDHKRRGQREQEPGMGKGQYNRPGPPIRNDAPRHLLPTPKEPPIDTDRPPRDGPRSRRDRGGPDGPGHEPNDGPGEMSGRPPRHEWRGKFDGPRSGENPDSRLVDSYIDKFGDPRFRCFADVGPQVSEEVAIGKRNFEIKVGGPPRKIKWYKDTIEVYADPAKRGILVDNKLVYRFGEKIKDVNVRGSNVKFFYHGRPLDIWIEGQHYEVRVDAPPKNIVVNGKNHKIKIDGRDMMILIDNEEKGRFGGEPRFIIVQDLRMELRFEPTPRHILIDGSSCELKLNTLQPCVNIKGVLHGIRFDGPPRDIVINDKLYQIYTDHAVKLRVGNRFYYVALGGPCHELIIDGKWYEVNFNAAPKEINIGKQVLMVRLPGSPPEVKILAEIAQERQSLPPGMAPPGMIMPGPGPPRMLGPGPPHIPGLGPPGMPDLRPMGHLGMPDMRMPGPGPLGMPDMGPPLGMPPPGMMMGPPGQMMGPPGSLPGMGPQGMPGPMPPVSGINLPSAAATMTGPNMIPGIGPPLPASNAGPSQLSSMPNVLSSLFTPVPSTSVSSAPIDITSLFAKLVNTGIIKKEPESSEASTSVPPATQANSVPPEYSNAMVAQKKPVIKVEKFDDIPNMTRLNPVEMKSLPSGMIQRLYSGIQCTSCGQRFATEDGEKTEQYRQHLDWHFRQNRKGKDDMKVTQCRKWYYGIEDWILYEEVADGEESGKSNFFEQQQQQPVEATPTSSANTLSLIVPEGVSIIKCPAATGNDDEDVCNICHEQFEQYWDEELEEWHLRDAISVNQKTFHPICYEDHTDVSEGTPSPSVLNVTEPGFKSKRSLQYDETAEDTPDSQSVSFDEERKYSPEVKQEPMESTPASDSVEPETSVSVKIEPVETNVTDTSIPFLADVKVEPNSESIPFLTDKVEHRTETIPFLTDVKAEPNTDTMEVDSPTDSGQTDISKVSTLEETSEKSPQVSIKQEPPEVDQLSSKNTEADIEVDAMALKDKDIPEEVGSSELVTSAVDDSHVAMDTNEHNITERIETEDDKETVDQAVIENTKPTIELSDPLEEPKTDHIECTTIDNVQSELEHEESSAYPIPAVVSSSVHVDSIAVLSDIHVETSNDYLAAPEQSGLRELQHSPTYSMLNKVKLSVPQEPLDISPEVLEIGSNASTPTRDELPSPECADT